jgi:hypothetical protein
MFSRSGKFMSDRQRKAMFSKLDLYEEDPKESRLSDKIAAVLGNDKTVVIYNKPEILVHTGGKSGGSYAHIFTKNLPTNALEYADGGISYNLGGDEQILRRGQAGGRVGVKEDNESEEEG